MIYVSGISRTQTNTAERKSQCLVVSKEGEKMPVPMDFLLSNEPVSNSRRRWEDPNRIGGVKGNLLLLLPSHNKMAVAVIGYEIRAARRNRRMLDDEMKEADGTVR